MSKRLICVALSLLMLWGCAPKTPSREYGGTAGVRVYYLDNSGLSSPRSPLEPETVYINIENSAQAADTLLGHMRSPTGSQNRSAIPENVEILGHSLDGGSLTVDFSVSFLNHPSFKRVLTVAALCLTMVQLPEVDFVKVRCGGEMFVPFGDAHLSESSFMLTESNGAGNKVNVTLYYVDTNEKLTAEQVSLSIEGEAVSPPAVIYLLMQPSQNAALRSPLEGRASVNSISISEDRICLLDINMPVSIKPGILDIYSIVNSLCENLDIDGVLMTVNKRPPSAFGVYGCDGVLTTNSSLLLAN